MANKYTVFYPSDIDLSDKVKDTVLWKAHYKLLDDGFVPEEIVEKIKTVDDPPIPLSHWRAWMEKLNLDLLFDFSYLKEYVYYVNNTPVFTVTIKALDLNTEHKEVIVRGNLAEKLVKYMDLKNQGSIHPEKFQNRLIDCIDLTDEDLINDDEILDILFDLESLCEYCLKYESFIEWKAVA